MTGVPASSAPDWSGDERWPSVARQSEAAAGKLARLTWVIIVLTVAVVGLTAALVILTLRGTG